MAGKKQGSTAKPRVERTRGRKGAVENPKTGYEAEVEKTEGRKRRNAAQPGPAKAEPGHNSGAGVVPNQLTDDEVRALTFIHTAHYREAMEAKKRADNEFKLVCKRMKADGVKLDQVKDIISLEDDPSAEKRMRGQIEDKVQTMSWKGVPVQMDLFPKDRRPETDKAYELGKQAGMRGDDATPPYAPGLPQGQKWLDGWHDGQKVRRDVLQKTMQQQRDQDAKEFDAPATAANDDPESDLPPEHEDEDEEEDIGA